MREQQPSPQIKEPQIVTAMTQGQMSMGQPSPFQEMSTVWSDDEDDIFLGIGHNQKANLPATSLSKVNSWKKGRMPAVGKCHCKEHFNSSMRGHNVRVLFAMAIGPSTTEPNTPRHNEPLFSLSK